jgi:hypothetical protein
MIGLYWNAYVYITLVVHIWTIRILYALAHLSCVLVILFLYLKARNNSDSAVVTVKEDLGFGQEGDKLEKISVGLHDQRVAIKEAQKVKSLL